MKVVIEVEVTAPGLTKDRLAAAANRLTYEVESAFVMELDDRRAGGVKARALVRVDQS